MQIAEGMHKLSRLKTRNLRHHHGKQSVGGDVEGNSEEAVGRALVELQAKTPVADIELEQGVAGGQRHVVYFSGVPCRYYDAARFGMVAYQVQSLRNLVQMSAIAGGPRAPLIAVDMAQVAVRACPFVPNAHSPLLQVAHVGVAGKKP